MSDPLYLDLETASVLDVRKVGASRLSRDPSTVVTVVAWAVGDGPVQSVVNPGRLLPFPITEHIVRGGVVSGWNSGGFELLFLRNYFGVDIRDDQISDTMQRAAYAGLPMALGEAGPALGLKVVKDRSAHDLMMRMARPRALEPLTWWHETDEEKLARLRRYCEDDVRAERAISAVIPFLSDAEDRVVAIDRRANLRGVYLDRDAVDAMLAAADAATKELNAEIAVLTDGAVTSAGTQVARLQAWLGPHAPPTLGKHDVEEALENPALPPAARRALEIRLLVAKSSVKKLNAMKACVDDDGFVRGLLVYSGAGRTHRWTSRLIQTQNMARPTIKRPEKALDCLLRGMDGEGLRLFWGEPLDVVSSCLRGAIAPRPGHVFVNYDLSSIEGRVVCWLAGQKDVLDVYRRGEDVYVYTQKKLGLGSRQEGKVAVLGLNYGMGPDKFVSTAAGYGLTYSREQAARIVEDYRQANDKIKRFWNALDHAAKAVLQAGAGRSMVVGKLRVSTHRTRVGSVLLTISLPSGAYLYYRDARVEQGDRGDAIVFNGVDQKTKRWSAQRTWGSKLVENVTQSVARDVLCDMLVRMDDARAGELVMTVHDEVLVETPIERADETCAAVHAIMNTAPTWAAGCPIAAEGGVKARYGK